MIKTILKKFQLLLLLKTVTTSNSSKKCMMVKIINGFLNCLFLIKEFIIIMIIRNKLQLLKRHLSHKILSGQI